MRLDLRGGAGFARFARFAPLCFLVRVWETGPQRAAPPKGIKSLSIVASRYGPSNRPAPYLDHELDPSNKDRPYLRVQA
jgi:hypothetical protein